MSETKTTTTPAPAQAPIQSLDDLSSRVAEVLAKRRAEAAKAASAPKKIDWATVTEEDIANPAVFIPVIDHDIPDYMNIKLKDNEYVPVWASKDRRRLGQLLAEGYEVLKAEHVHPSFKLPLRFESDGTYTYLDVICMRVHKSIIFSKRRKALEISQKQLRNTNRPPRVKDPRTGELSEEDLPLGPGMKTYDAGL